MTILDNVLQEEYDRSKRMKEAMENELSQLPKGYISKKTINSKVYFYLQRRDGLKVVSSYIPLDELPEIEEQVAKRKQIEESIKTIVSNMKKIGRVIK